jgi:hypothetical protein
MAMEYPWGTPTIPKVLFEFIEGDQDLNLEELTRGLLFISRTQVLTGLTSAFRRSDRCWPPIGFCSDEHLSVFPSLLDCYYFEFGVFLSSGGWALRFGVSRIGPVWPVSCTSLTGVGALFGNLQVLLKWPGSGSRVTRCVSGGCRVIKRLSPDDLALTGLTGPGDRSDRCG